MNLKLVAHEIDFTLRVLGSRILQSACVDSLRKSDAGRIPPVKQREDVGTIHSVFTGRRVTIPYSKKAKTFNFHAPQTPTTQSPHKAHPGSCRIDMDSIQIFVRTFSGRTLTISTCPDATVQEIKIQMFQKLNLRPDLYDVYLLFESKPLHDEYTLSFYNITHNSTLHVAGRLNGGGGRPEVWQSAKEKRYFAPTDGSHTEWLKGFQNGEKSCCVVDTSVLMWILATIDPENIAAQLYMKKIDRKVAAEMFADLMLEYLAWQIDAFGIENTYFVFEELKTTEKAVKDERTKILSSMINNALRTIHKSTAFGHEGAGMSQLNKAVGLDWSFQCELMDVLEAKGAQKRQTQGEADAAMVKLAKELKRQNYKVFFLSSDCDCLVFPRSDAYYALITPTKKTRSVVILKEVQTHFDLTWDQLVARVCISGCDNVAGVKQVGWKGSLTLIRIAEPGSTYPEIFDAIINKDPKTIKNAVRKADFKRCKRDTVAFLKRFDECTYSADTPKNVAVVDRLQAYLNETKENGQLRRAKLKAWFDNPEPFQPPETKIKSHQQFNVANYKIQNKTYKERLDNYDNFVSFNPFHVFHGYHEGSFSSRTNFKENTKRESACRFHWWINF